MEEPSTKGMGLSPKSTPYYRSRAFISQTGVNPLLAACAPVFFLIEKVKQLKTAPNFSKLREDLVHEVKAFEHQAENRAYPSQTILSARYLMCAWIDDALIHVPWHWQGEWREHALSEEPEPNGQYATHPFFLMLERYLQYPDSNLDLIELCYLCLSLGFLGHYRSMPDAHEQLVSIQDHTFETIQRRRGELNSTFELNLSEASPVLIQKRTRNLWFLPISLMLGILILPITYAGLAYWIHLETHTATAALSAVDKEKFRSIPS